MAHWPSMEIRHQSDFPQMGQGCLRVTRDQRLVMAHPPLCDQARDRHDRLPLTAIQGVETEIDERRFERCCAV
jgi:hypothetical protein